MLHQDLIESLEFFKLLIRSPYLSGVAAMSGAASARLDYLYEVEGWKRGGVVRVSGGFAKGVKPMARLVLSLCWCILAFISSALYS